MILLHLDDPIVTDRPDFTESALVVPLFRRQLETGFTFECASGADTLTLPEALFRYGVARNWEIRLGSPDFQRTAGLQGWGDSYVGAKHQLGPIGSYDVAVILATTVPTGRAAMSARRFEPEWNLCVSRDLTGMDSLSGMLRHSPSARSLDFTLSYGRSLSDRTSLFAEYAGTCSNAQPAHIAHGGIVFRPSPDRQFDLHFGARINAERLAFIGAGYSVRF